MTKVFALTLPQDFELDSIGIEFSYDGAHLIVYNSSGSILSYKWHKDTGEAETQYVYKECSMNHQFVEDISDSVCMSLEQQRQFEAENAHKVQVQRRKAEILEIIAKLKNEFAAIKDQNSKFPVQFRMDDEFFEIDKRLTENLNKKTQEKFQIIQAELQTKIDKMRRQAERMEQLYLDHLEHWPISITGFR